MFYETEIRREDEYRTDPTNVSEKELELALLLVNSLAAPFDPSKYRDRYREKLDALIAAKLQALPSSVRDAPKLAPIVNILEALQSSLQSGSKRNGGGAPSSKGSRKRQKVRTNIESTR